MSSCPNCQQSVEILDKHWGTLFNCPHCNAVFFVDWNGNPEMTEHEVTPEMQEPTLPPEPDIVEAGTTFEGGSDFEGGMNFEPPPSQDFSNFGGSQEFVNSVDPSFSGEIPQEVSDEMAPQEDPYLAPAEEINPGAEFQAGTEEVAPYDFNQPLGAIEPEPILDTDSPDFSDVTDFANADIEAGPLSYLVVIEGIETSHLLFQLKEAMTDSRFGWDVNSLVNQVGGGRLVLRRLSPAKASVLINRIKYLPFKISWRQDVLSNS